jgi:hypothetical protein
VYELVEFVGFIEFIEFIEFKGSAKDKGIESRCQEQAGVEADFQIFCLTARNG